MSSFAAEKCKCIISSKFDLVILASQRARDLSAGIKPLLESNLIKNDKSPIVALKEIAAGKLSIKDLKRSVIRRNRLNVTDFGYIPKLYEAPKEAESNAEGAINAASDDIKDIFFGDDNIEDNN